MKFPRFEYMTWAKSIECTPGIHLSSSGLSFPTQAALGLDKTPPRVHQISSYGDPELLDAIAERYRTKVESVFLAPGSSGANYTAMGVLLESDDEVLIEAPAYEVLAQIPVSFGAQIKRVVRDQKNSWKVDFVALREQITNKTRLLVFTNPHNPTGATFDKNELTQLKELAEANDFYVLFDEVFIEMIADKFKVSALNRSDKFIVTSSVTKAFGLGGLRVGWAVADPELIERMKFYQDLMSVNVADPSQDIALRIFRNIDSFLDKGKRILEQNSEIVKNWLSEHDNIDFWLNPEIAFCFPRLKNVDIDKFIEFLGVKYNTFTVPGRFFTNFAENIRLGYGIDKDLLTQGLQNIDSALKQF